MNKAAYMRLLPLLIFAVGVGVTFVAEESVRRAGDRTLRDRFEFRFDEITLNIEERLSGYEQALKGVAGLFAASQQVERGEFRAYVAGLELDRHYPGVQGIGFSLRVSPEDLVRHIQQIRREGFPQYSIRPSGDRDTYTSIIYLEPFNWRNQRAFGYDMFSEQVRREAMVRARDEDRASISGKVRLVQETERDIQAGFLMYVPVYRNSMPHNTREERRANLVGWAYAPFRMDDLMRGILRRRFGEINDVVDLEIYDGDTVSTATLMYDANKSPEKLEGRFQAFKHIEVAGHRWTLALYSLPAFDADRKTDTMWFIAIGGAGGSLLISWIVWLLMTGRARAQSLASSMTSELRESEAHLKALFENMSSGVAIYRASPDGQDFFFTDYNRAAETMDLKTREQVIGRNLRDVFPNIGDLGLLEVLRRVWRSGVAERIPATHYQDETLSGWRENYVCKISDGSVVAIYDDVTEQISAQMEEQRLNHALRLLSACNAALVRANDENWLLNEICQLVIETGGYFMAWVGYAQQDENKSVRPMAQHGFDEGYLDSVNITWADTERGRGPTGTAIRTGLTEVNQDYFQNPRMAPWREAALQRGYRSSIALPLRTEQGVLGALTIYSRFSSAFFPEEVKLLEELANDLAFGIVTLRTRIAHDAAVSRLQRGMESTIQAFATMLEMRDPYTAGHQSQVAALAVAIAGELGLSEDEIYGIQLAARIHDVGKLRIPVETLTKPGRLGALEYQLIQTHVEAGYDILKGIDFPWPIAQLVLQHHERLNGSGYPNGVKGQDILLGAKILAVADTVEAMTRDRPYRPGLGVNTALQEIRINSGTLYEPTVVDACEKLFTEGLFEFAAQLSGTVASG